MVEFLDLSPLSSYENCTLQSFAALLVCWSFHYDRLCFMLDVLTIIGVIVTTQHSPLPPLLPRFLSHSSAEP